MKTEDGLLSKMLEEGHWEDAPKIYKSTKKKKKTPAKKKKDATDVPYVKFLEEECQDLKDKIQMKTPDGAWIKEIEGSLEKADPQVQINCSLIKNRILARFCSYAEPDVFYQDLFHFETEGRFLTKVVLKDAPKKKPIVRKVKDKTIEIKTGTYDDAPCGSDSFERYRDRVDAYVPPVKFFNTKKENGVVVKKDYIHCCKETIEKIYAFVADVDCVMPYDLYDFLNHGWSNHINGKTLPKPTYIVNSGNGLHLYYCLDVPEHVYDFNVKEMEGLLNKIQEVCSQRGGGFLSNKPIQPFALTQSFRVVGSKSKRGMRVTAYSYGDRWSLDGLCESFDYPMITKDIKTYSKRERQRERERQNESGDLTKAQYHCVKLGERIIERTPEDCIEDAMRIWSRCAKSSGLPRDAYIVMRNRIINEVPYSDSIDSASLVLISEDAHRCQGLDQYVVCSEDALGFNNANKNQGKIWIQSYKRVLNAIKEEGNLYVGNRFNSVKMAACRAYQCGVSAEVFESDMEELWSFIQKASDQWVPFTREEFNLAKDAYYQKYHISIKDMEKILSDEKRGRIWKYSYKTEEEKMLAKKKAELKSKGLGREDDEKYHLMIMFKILGDYIESVFDSENPEKFYFPSPSDLVEFVDGDVYTLPFVDQNTGEDREVVSGDYYNYWARHYDALVEKFRLSQLAETSEKIEVYQEEASKYPEDVKEKALKLLDRALNLQYEEGLGSEFVYYLLSSGEKIRVYFRKSKEEEIESYFKKNPNSSVNKASKELGIAYNTVSKYVKKLKEEGRL